MLFHYSNSKQFYQRKNSTVRQQMGSHFGYAPCTQIKIIGEILVANRRQTYGRSYSMDYCMLVFCTKRTRRITFSVGGCITHYVLKVFLYNVIANSNDFYPIYNYIFITIILYLNHIFYSLY